MKKTTLSFLIAVTLGISGCGTDVAEQLKQGYAHLHENNLRAAGIEFKAVLQDDRNNLSARMGLAELHLKTNDAQAEEKELLQLFQAAEPEFKKHQISRVDIANRLARLYARTDNAQGLRDLDGLGSPEVAYLQSVELLQDVKVDVNTLPEINAGPYRNLQTVAELMVTHPLQALDAAKELLGSDSGKTDDAYQSHKNILLFQLYAMHEKTEDAIAALSRYVAQQPFDYPRAMQLAHMYISVSEHASAKPLVTELLKKFPRHALVNEMSAVLHYQDKNYDLALTAANTASLADPNTKMARIIAAYSAYHLSKNEQALEELEQVAPLLDGSHPAKRLYLQLKAMAGKGTADEMVEDIQSLTDLTPEDVSLLSQVGLAMARQGKLEHARKIAEKAKTVDLTDNNASASALGLLQLSLGDQQAFSRLEAQLSANRGSIEIGNALASAYLANQQYENALQVADKIATTQPAQSNLIKGLVMAATDDHVSAAKHYQQVLAIEPENMVSQAGLIESYVAMDLFDKAQPLLASKTNVAEQVVLFRHYLGAMKRAQKSDEALKVSKQILSDRTEEPLRLVLSQAYFLAGDWRKVLETMPAQTSEAGKFEEYWLMKVGALMQLNDKVALSLAYQGWLQAIPNSQMALMGRISALTESKQIEEAISVLETHQSLHQEQTPIELMKFHLQVMARKFAAARESWSSLPDNVQKSTVGIGLAAILKVVDGDFDAAISGLEPLYKEIPSEQYLMWLYFAYEGKQDLAGGIKVLQTHVQQHPDSFIARAYLGNAYAQTSQFKEAKEQYLAVMEKEQKNTLVLNNLAFVLVSLGEFSEAERYAREALILLPDNESISDTLANALIGQDRFAEAAKVLEPFFSAQMEDSTATTRIKLLIKQGKKTDAANFYNQHNWQKTKPESSTLGL